MEIVFAFLVLGYVMICLLVSAFAASRDRSWFGFFLLALFTSPILAFLIVLFLPVGRWKCPYCASNVRTGATVCAHCGRAFSVAAGQRI